MAFNLTHRVRATVITDASYSDIDGKAGWAAWVRVDGVDGPIKEYASFRCKVESSTDAEIMAAINGMWLAARHGATDIVLQSDCMLVVQLASGLVNSNKQKDKWSQLVARARLLGMSIDARHVKGHTSKKDARSYVNRWCDSHANKARRSHGV